MDEEAFKASLRTWFSDVQLAEEGVRWDVNDGILRWQEIEEQYGWYRRIGKLLQPKRYLEVGVGFGYSTLSLLSDLDKLPRIYWIDNESGWKNSVQHAKNSLRETYDHEVECCRTWDEFPYSLLTFDLIHIDAGHTYVDVLQDLIFSWPHWTKGVHVMVHDTDDPPVSKAIEDFVFTRTNLSVISLPVRCGLKVIHSCEGDCPLYGLL